MSPFEPLNGLELSLNDLELSFEQLYNAFDDILVVASIHLKVELLEQGTKGC
jgi:hypothetical protein